MYRPALLSSVVTLAAALAVAQQASDSAAAQAPDAAAAVGERLAELKGKCGALEESYLETKAIVDKLAKIKVSGYVQAQFRMAMDTAGWLDAMGKSRYRIGNFAGGSMADNAAYQFQVRRGRVKVMYDAGLSQYVLQLDAVPSGVTIKDAYAYFMEPWVKSFGLKAGVFDRPFGYEISYSSSSRESPERSRLFQTLFPGERDMGLQLDYTPSDNLPAAARMLNVKVGGFTGNGIANETDMNKDVIGRLGFKVPLNDLNMAIDGGFSGYYGKVTNTDTTWSRSVSKIDSSGFTTKTSYVFDSAQGKTVPVFTAAKRYDTTWTVTGRGFDYQIAQGEKAFTKSSAGQMGKDYVRQYIGGDLQLYADLPVVGGIALRGEVIGGKQPATKGASTFYNPGRSSSQPVYQRDFLGYYGMLTLNVNAINSQLVLKYDVYDPNTAVRGDDIDSTALAKSGLSSTDLAYTTVGGGINWYMYENVKLVVYYDHVMNEKMNGARGSLGSSNKVYAEDLKDDVLTVRLQYKF